MHSPPRIAPTQLLSTTRPWLTSTGTSTPLVVRPHGRTVPLRGTRPTRYALGSGVVLAGVENAQYIDHARTNTVDQNVVWMNHRFARSEYAAVSVHVGLCRFLQHRMLNDIPHALRRF